MTLSGSCQPDGICNHSVQHRLDVYGRPCDRAQDIVCRNLLLQVFGELTLTILQLFGQFGELLAQLCIRRGLSGASRLYSHTGQSRFSVVRPFGCHKSKTV